ncbi:MAG: DNA-binding response regulator [Lachnospiraceae bacterium]|nr:DNA-binding response regulator [Lachnospiraceae bacterium]
MISLLICMENKKQEAYIVKLVRKTIAVLSDEELEIISYLEDKSAAQNAASTGRGQIAVIDVTGKTGFDVAKEVRAHSAQTEIMIIADTSISPIRYLNPEVKASSLLLKPFVDDVAKESFQNFIRQVVATQDPSTEEECIILNRRSEDVAIPFRNVYYVEARNKKVYVNCSVKEYVVYESLDAIVATLPDYFIRCHRSFVVNRRHIQSVEFSENYIRLDNKDEIPFSRGQKNILKEVLGSDANA